MVWLDWALVAIVISSALLSLWRGFMREAIALAGWVVAVILARLFHEDLAKHLSDDIQPARLKLVVAWIVIFIVVLIIGFVIAKLSQALVEKAGLTTADRLLGMGFGIVRGLVLCAVFVMLCKAFTRIPSSDAWDDSRLVGPVETVADWLVEAWDEHLD